MPTIKLLVVEDDPGFQAVYRERLVRLKGLTLDEVAFCKTPKQAQRFIADGVRVVILDHRLIGGTGSDLVDWAADFYPEVRFVRCSTLKEGQYPIWIPWFEKGTELSKALSCALTFLTHMPVIPFGSAA